MQDRAERCLGRSLRSHVLCVVSYLDSICRLWRFLTLVTSCLVDTAWFASGVSSPPRLWMVGPVRTRIVVIEFKSDMIFGVDWEKFHSEGALCVEYYKMVARWQRYVAFS